MKPVISGQPPASMKSSVAYGQRPPNSAPPTLYTFIKEAGEKVLGNWPDSRQQSQEFGKLVLQATRPILHNLVESCKGDIAPSTGIKIGVENFVAATYDASYACGKTLTLSRVPLKALKAARNDYAVQLFLALRILDVEAKGYKQYLLPEPFLHQVQVPSWHAQYLGPVIVGLLSVLMALIALASRSQ